MNIKEQIQSNIKELANRYGIANQIHQFDEESAELTVELHKYLRNKPCNTLTEMADIEIMVEQLKYLLEIDEKDLDYEKLYKSSRQLKRSAESDKIN